MLLIVLFDTLWFTRGSLPCFELFASWTQNPTARHTESYNSSKTFSIQISVMMFD